MKLINIGFGNLVNGDKLVAVVAPDAAPIFGDVPFTGVNMPLEAFDTTPIQEDCGFKTTVSFAEGTRRTMEWLKQL